MIVMLRGVLRGVTEHQITLDVNGVFYALHCSKKTSSHINTLDSECTVFVEHLFRQENQLLCAFITEDEREAFRLLMGVQGVGLRVALSILSLMSAWDIAQAVVNKRDDLFKQAEGVGPKLASRIVVEMKDKINQFYTQEPLKSDLPISVDFNDAQSALINLGYSRYEVFNVIKDIYQQNNHYKAEDLIKAALQKLARIA